MSGRFAPQERAVGARRRYGAVMGEDVDTNEAIWKSDRGVSYWVTTAEEVPDPGDLRLQTWVNGQLRQDSRTSDLIFGCDELVEFIRSSERGVLK